MKKIILFIISFFIAATFFFTCQIKNRALAQDNFDIAADAVDLKRIGITETKNITTSSISGEHIKAFNSSIFINKNGMISVEEKIIYDFGESKRHGIFREIPFIKTNQNGKKYQLDFSDFSVTDENTTAYQYTVVKENDKIKLKIGDPDKTISGVHTYIISYKVAGALTYFSDHDELYWNVTGNEWEVVIAQAKAEIFLPEKIGEENLKFDCFTGFYRSKNKNCQYHLEYDRGRDGTNVIFSSDNLLNPREGLTIVISFPKNITAILEPKPVVSFFDTLFGKIVFFGLFLLVTYWYLIYPFKIIYKWYKYGRDPKGITGEARAWFDPPKTPDGKRFLMPAEVGTLGDETVDLKDISATIIDLARRGYLKIEERKKGDFYFVKTREFSNLLSFEKKLLEGIFGKKQEIRLKDKRLYETVEEVKKELYEDVVTEGLFPKNPQSIRTFYTVIGGIAFLTFNFFLAVVAFLFGRNLPVKTVEGVSAFNIAKSLKNFLTSQERQLAFQADKQMFFEKLLPYAVAFGVEKIWAKRFQDIDLKPPDWYQGYDNRTFNSVIFANNLSSSMSSFRSSAAPPTSTRSTSGFSSGFSGGFSGGGGGGGGGGSW